MTGLDPLEDLIEASARKLIAAEDTIEQLKKGNGSAPLVLLVDRARIEAAEAIEALVAQPTTDPGIAKRQEVVLRYRKLTDWIRDIVIEGNEAAAEILEHTAQRESNNATLTHAEMAHMTVQNEEGDYDDDR